MANDDRLKWGSLIYGWFSVCWYEGRRDSYQFQTKTGGWTSDKEHFYDKSTDSSSFFHLEPLCTQFIPNSQLRHSHIISNHVRYSLHQVYTPWSAILLPFSWKIDRTIISHLTPLHQESMRTLKSGSAPNASQKKQPVRLCYGPTNMDIRWTVEWLFDW